MKTTRVNLLLVFVLLQLSYSNKLNSQIIDRRISPDIHKHSLFPQSADVNIQEGLVGYWKFDEIVDDTIIEDKSGIGNHGKIYASNDVVYKNATTVDGIVGNALVFDDSVSYVEIETSSDLDNDLTKNFTISLWFKCDNGENGYLVSKCIRSCDDKRAWVLKLNTDYCAEACPHVGIGVRWGIDLYDDKGSQQCEEASINIATSQCQNIWHHLVVTFKESSFKVYFDGDFAGNVDINTSGSFYSNTMGLRIGNTHDDSSLTHINFAYQGAIDELRVYNRRLNQPEISLLYLIGKNGLDDVVDPNSNYTRPPKPVLLSITSEYQNRIDIEWESADDDVIGYNIYRKIRADSDYSLIANVPVIDSDKQIFSDFIDIDNYPENSSICYAVSAYDIVGEIFGLESERSNNCCITPNQLSIVPVFQGAEGLGVERDDIDRVYEIVDGIPNSNNNPNCKDEDNNPINCMDIASKCSLEVAANELKCYIEKHNNNCYRNQHLVILFEIAGTLDMGKALGQKKNLEIRRSHITIAGQTAPGPGITLKGCGIWIDTTSNVMIQHLRIRPGDAYIYDDNNNIDSGWVSSYSHALLITGNDDHSGIPKVGNIIIDHCSMSWGIDENVDIGYEGVENVTISNCIISEGLHKSYHLSGSHSAGVHLNESVKNIALIKNLLAHNNGRNPRLLARTSSLIANNLVYNPGKEPTAAEIGYMTYYDYCNIDLDKNEITSTIINNVIITGANRDQDCPSTGYFVRVYPFIDLNSKIYVRDHDKFYNFLHCKYFPYRYKKVLYWDNSINHSIADIKSYEIPVWSDLLSVWSTRSVKNNILKNVGARPNDRDPIDKRLIDDISDGNNSTGIINTQRYYVDLNNVAFDEKGYPNDPRIIQDVRSENSYGVIDARRDYAGPSDFDSKGYPNIKGESRTIKELIKLLKDEFSLSDDIDFTMNPNALYENGPYTKIEKALQAAALYVER